METIDYLNPVPKVAPYFPPLKGKEEYIELSGLFLPVNEAEKADVALIGAGLDAGTTKPVGPKSGPDGVRKGLSTYKTYSEEVGVELRDLIKLVDLGDIEMPINNVPEAFKRISYVLAETLSINLIPIVFGGDHSVTQATFKSFSEHFGGDVGLIWVDKHFDTMPTYRGEKYTTGSSLLRILEQDLVKPENVVHLGAYSFFNFKICWDYMRKYGIKVITAEDIERQGIIDAVNMATKIANNGVKSFYVTLDVDVLDGSFAPGTQSATTGGLTSSQLMRIIQMLSLAGAGGFDLVEFAPPLDIGDITARLAGGLVMEFLGGVAKRKQ